MITDKNVSHLHILNSFKIFEKKLESILFRTINWNKRNFRKFKKKIQLLAKFNWLS